MDPLRRPLVAGAVLATLLAIGFVLSPASAVENTRSLLNGPWFPLVLVGLYLLRPFLAWPISALSILVGFRYGPMIGFPIAMTGAIATSLIPFGVARYLPTGTGLLGRAADGSERYFAATGDLRGVVAARLAPVPAEVISAGAGFGRVSIGAFVIGTAIGETPWVLAAVLAGHSLERLALAGVDTVAPHVVAIGLLGGLVLLAGPTYRVLRERWPRTAIPGSNQ